jgi:predicted amidohydrolase
MASRSRLNHGSVLRVALAQVDCVLGDVEENLARTKKTIDEAARQGAQLIVFPELNLTGYAIGAISEDVALTADDPIITELADRAGETSVVVGFVENGLVHTYNSCIYLEAGRGAHLQRKAYLPSYGRFEEHKHFSPGQSVRAFDTRWGRAAMLICNDVWQPPLPFLCVHDGARLLVVPACSALDADVGTDPGTERDWNELLRFYARFLQIYVVFVNRVGEESGVRFWGGSRVVDPWGNDVVHAPKHEPALLLADIELDNVRRRRHEMPLIKEARLTLLSRELNRLIDSGT